MAPTIKLQIGVPPSPPAFHRHRWLERHTDPHPRPAQSSPAQLSLASTEVSPVTPPQLEPNPERSSLPAARGVSLKVTFGQMLHGKTAIHSNNIYPERLGPQATGQKPHLISMSTSPTELFMSHRGAKLPWRLSDHRSPQDSSFFPLGVSAPLYGKMRGIQGEVRCLAAEPLGAGTISGLRVGCGDLQERGRHFWDLQNQNTHS